MDENPQRRDLVDTSRMKDARIVGRRWYARRFFCGHWNAKLMRRPGHPNGSPKCQSSYTSRGCFYANPFKLFHLKNIAVNCRLLYLYLLHGRLNSKVSFLTFHLQAYFYFLCLQSGSFLFSPSFFTASDFQKCEKIQSYFSTSLYYVIK